MRLGLTGGMGSGKSTVARLWAAAGAAVVDADAISRAATAANGLAIAPIEAALGPGVITPERAVNRQALRHLIYADSSAKTRLEGILHPLIGAEMERQAGTMHAAGSRCIVFDIPLLVESGHWRRVLDYVLVVDCSPATQMARVAARDGLEAAEIAKILATQASRSQRLRAADWVLCNDGITHAELTEQVGDLANQFGLSFEPPEKTA